MAKIKVATAHMAGCFGCHMSLLDIDELLVKLIELVDFDKSPIDDIKKFTGKVDVGIIEGGCSSQENYEVLHSFRKHCKILVAVGECALTGGVPAMRNTIPLKECFEEAYLKGPSVVDGVIPNDPDIPLMLDKVYPLHEVVKIDYFIPGCPPPADAFWQVLTALLEGREPEISYEALKFD